MSYENFKPTIWSHFIQRELEKKCKLVADCWKQFEGEVKHGEAVKILGVGSPTIRDYDGTAIEGPEAITDSATLMNIDQRKYFNFMVDDVDRAQSVPGLMEALMAEATHKMALAQDSFVASLAKDHDLISAGAAITTAADAKKAIDAGLLALRENDVDIEDNVVIEIAPFLHQLFRDDLIELKTDNDELIRKGVVGYYDGAEVKLSNNLYKDGNDMYYNMIRTKKAIAFASQIHETEAYRPESFFSDAVKGLDVFGAKIVRPRELYVLKASK